MVRKLIVLLSLTSLVVGGAALSQVSKPNSSPGAVNTTGTRSDVPSAGEADFVFLGTVTNIQYKTQAGHPYTYVTYNVEQYLSNPQQLKQVTLRFYGGPVGDCSKTGIVNGKCVIADMSEAPSFDKQDRDILYVRGNGVALCPLVNWSGGRLRVVNNGVYSNEGRAVLTNPQGALVYGSIVSLPQVETNKVGDVVVRSIPSTPPKSTGDHSTLTPENRLMRALSPTPPASLDDVINVIQSQPVIEAAGGPIKGKASVSINDPIPSLNTTPVAPTVPANAVSPNAQPQRPEPKYYINSKPR